MRTGSALALAWLVACGGGTPERFEGCDDLDCQARWVVARWETSPDAVTQAIGSLSDPVARIALVREVGRAWPGRTGALCSLVPSGDAAAACKAQNERPHLAQVKIQDLANASTEQDSDVHGFHFDRPLPSPWRDVAADHASCGGELLACQTAATQRAQDGDLRGAAATCQALDVPAERANCYFKAAETTASLKGAQGGRSASLCLGAASFAGRCLSHVVEQIGTNAPRAGSEDRSGWAGVAEAIEAARAAIQPADAALSQEVEAQAWAYALRVSFAQELEPSALPFALVPPSAAPHARAALAWRLWNLEGLQTRDLAAWELRLRDVMADQSTRRPRKDERTKVSHLVRDLWEEDLPGEEVFTKITYLGSARRALAPEPEADLLVCLLEAAARAQGNNKAILAEALTHPDPVVRWTAARLLATIAPNHGALRRRSADPRVQARLGER